MPDICSFNNIWLSRNIRWKDCHRSKQNLYLFHLSYSKCYHKFNFKLQNCQQTQISASNNSTIHGSYVATLSDWFILLFEFVLYSRATVFEKKKVTVHIFFLHNLQIRVEILTKANLAQENRQIIIFIQGGKKGEKPPHLKQFSLINKGLLDSPCSWWCGPVVMLWHVLFLLQVTFKQT